MDQGGNFRTARAGGERSASGHGNGRRPDPDPYGSGEWQVTGNTTGQHACKDVAGTTGIDRRHSRRRDVFGITGTPIKTERAASAERDDHTRGAAP